MKKFLFLLFLIVGINLSFNFAYALGPAPPSTINIIEPTTPDKGTVAPSTATEPVPEPNPTTTEDPALNPTPAPDPTTTEATLIDEPSIHELLGTSGPCIYLCEYDVISIDPNTFQENCGELDTVTLMQDKCSRQGKTCPSSDPAGCTYPSRYVTTGCTSFHSKDCL